MRNYRKVMGEFRRLSSSFQAEVDDAVRGPLSTLTGDVKDSLRVDHDRSTTDGPSPAPKADPITASNEAAGTGMASRTERAAG